MRSGACRRVRCFDGANRPWQLGCGDANAVTRCEVCERVSRHRVDSTASERTHSRLLTSRRIDDALDSGVRAQPGVLARGGASVLIEVSVGVFDCVVVAVLQPVQIVRRRGDVQNVLTGFGTTAGECGFRMLTLIDDARERALLGVDLNRVRTL